MQNLITSPQEIRYELTLLSEGTVFRFRTVDTFQVVFFVKLDSDYVYCINAKKLYQTGNRVIKKIKLSRLKAIRVF